MITYFKTTTAILFPYTCKPTETKVKSIVFRDDDEKCSIDCISLDGRGKFVCYEQWSIPGNKKDYRQCHQELRTYAARPMNTLAGNLLFKNYENQEAASARQKKTNWEEVYESFKRQLR